MFGNGKRDASYIHLLKGVESNHLARHLPRDAHHRRGIEHCGRNARNHVGRARARSRDSDSDFSARASVAIRHVGGALFMPHQHVMYGIAPHGIVGGQNRAPGIAEDVRRALAHHALPNNLCAGLFHWLLNHGDSITAPNEAEDTCRA